MRLVAFLLAVALPGGLAAQTYRWVDERGQVHYTQVPPKAGKYDLIGPAPPPAAAPNQEALNKALSDAQAAEPRQQQEAEKLAQEQARRQEACKQALERVAYLDARTPRRLATTDDKGNVSRMTDEEFQRQRAEAQARADQNC